MHQLRVDTFSLSMSVRVEIVVFPWFPGTMKDKKVSLFHLLIYVHFVVLSNLNLQH